MMKKLWLTIGMALSLMAEIDWRMDYDEALKEARKSHKPLLIVIVSHSCRWCRRLEYKTLGNPKVEQYVRRHYIPVMLYREDRAYPDALAPRLVPTTYYLDPAQKPLIEPSIGYLDPDDYLFELEMGLKRFRSRLKNKISY
jgi:hypothetical protein